MAQSGFTPISIYYSTTASAVPTAANLVPGELAINTADGKLYYEDSSGVVQVLATKSTGSIGGSNTQVQFNNSGSLGGSSSFTWDGTTVTATKFAGALNGTVGATTASTGAFTTLTSNGATTFTAGTASTSTTTGTTVITGGLGVSGRINAANFDGIVGANTAAAGSFTTLSASGVATFSAGTVSLPAITTTGDTNTGIYFPAADTIAFTEGGTEAMRITSAGIVDIGGTSGGSAGELLVVEGANSAGHRAARINNTSTTNGYSTLWMGSSNDGLIRGGSTAGAFTDQLLLLTSGSIPISFYTANTERMRIDSSGNVGIGTSSPTALLQLSSTGNPGLVFDGTNQAANLKRIRLVTQISAAGDFAIQSMNDAGTVKRTNLYIDSSGIITMSAYGAGAATFSAAGVISSVSDETWKTKDGVPTNTDAMLQKLEPGYWFYNEEKAPTFGEERQLGFYAQNVHEAIGEEAAPTPQEGKPWGYHDRSVLAIAVMSLKNALNTIEELKQRIETLENK